MTATLVPAPSNTSTSAARSHVRARTLRVVPDDGRQDCERCRNVRGCWQAKGTKPIQPADIVTNLLVCRILRGIDRERSTRLFLQLIQPKLRKMAHWVHARTQLPLADLITEMESVAIETLLKHYVMGEQAPPMIFLFHVRYGGVRHWALQTVERQRRERTLSYELSGSNWIATTCGEVPDLEARLDALNEAVTQRRVRQAPRPLDDDAPDASTLTPEQEGRYQQALTAVEDGATLSATEYRVLKFCLTNARESGRATDRLHQWLAETMATARKRVSRFYGLAVRKLIGACGLRGSYLRARGVDAPATPRTPTRPLSPDEVVHALTVLERARGQATLLDIAWALGVTEESLRLLRLRYGAMTEQQIREQLERRSAQ